MADPPRYRLFIESIARDDRPVEVRLQHVVEGLLPVWGFRCRSITLDIESVARAEVPVWTRLRHVLKGLLRGWGFRCKSVEEVRPDALARGLSDVRNVEVKQP